MVQVVKADDVERMLIEAFQQGHANDPQLIPNLISSLRNFMPTFEVSLTAEEEIAAQAKATESAMAFLRKKPY